MEDEAEPCEEVVVVGRLETWSMSLSSMAIAGEAATVDMAPAHLVSVTALVHSSCMHSDVSDWRLVAGLLALSASSPSPLHSHTDATSQLLIHSAQFDAALLLEYYGSPVPIVSLPLQQPDLTQRHSTSRLTHSRNPPVVTQPATCKCDRPTTSISSHHTAPAAAAHKRQQ